MRPWYVLGLPDPAIMLPPAAAATCSVTSRISAVRLAVGYMLRPLAEPPSWQFMAGDEDQAHMDDPERGHRFSVTRANHDPAAIPFLDTSPGTAWGRSGTTFVEEPSPWADHPA